MQTSGTDLWNDSPAYYLPYRVNGGDCNHSALHCVPVDSGNIGPGWYGLTIYVVNSPPSTHINHDSMHVYFNSYYTMTQVQKNSTVCHELGHASGVLSEGSNTNSCIYEFDTSFPLNPSTHDYNIIESKYNH